MSKVTIYTTTTCPYCHAEKEYLASRGVGFEEIILDKQPDKAVEALHNCGSMGVPCTHIEQSDGTVENILGFDKPRLDKALGLS
jgi:glutaredoxin 3